MKQDTKHINNGRILLVDDCELLRKTLRRCFSVLDGIEVVGEAENGRDAIEQIELCKPSLIIIDVAMPVMDGIQATNAIKRNNPEIKIIAYTSKRDKHTIQSMQEAGANCFVTKDTDLDRLLEIVLSVLQSEEGDDLFCSNIHGS